MVKLSEQLIGKSGRLTRTQRQLEQQERTRRLLEDKERFEKLKAEAEEVQRTKLSKTKTIEEFETEYRKLRPEIQQFFSTPQELTQQKIQRIEKSKAEIQSDISITKKQQQDLGIAFEKSKSEIPKLDPNERASFKRDITDDFREQSAFLSERLSGLREGLTRLETGEDLSAGDIERFARSKGAIAEEREKERSKREPAVEKKVTRISATKFLQEKLRGLKKKGETKTVRDVKGGFSEVSIYEKGKEKVQIVRSKETGKVFVKDIGGKDKGEFVEFRGLSDKELELEQIRLQDEAIKTFEEARKEKPFFLDVEAIERGQVARRETIVAKPPTEFIPIRIDEGKDSIIGRAFGVIKRGLAKTGDIKIPIFTITGAGGEIPLRELKEPVEKKISEKRQELFLKELEETGIKAQLEAEAQEEFQVRFEDRFFKQLIKGEVTFEKAEKEFKESREAKIIGIKFEKRVEKRRRELLAGKITARGFAIAGLTTAELGLKLIPETIGGAILETGAIVVGIKAIKFIPPAVSTIATGVIGGLGTLEAVSPIALPEEKAGGIITAGISFTLLGLRGIRFLRRPTIKAVKITPKPTLTPQQQTGLVKKVSSKIVTDVTGKVTQIEKFKARRISEQVVAGRRTIVSTKFREIVRLDPVFKGVPFTAKGRVGFQKALKILQKRLGLTETQARSILRFRQPRLILSKFEADVLIKSGELFERPLIALKGTRDITQPIINIEKALGIKTRGAVPIREFITGRGRIVGVAPTGEQILKMTFDIEKTFITPTGAVFQKLTQAGRTTRQISQLTLVKKTGKDVIRVQRRLGGIVVQTEEFPLDIFTERTIAKTIIPRGRVFVGKGRTAVIRTDIIPEEIDLRKILGFKIKEIRTLQPIKEVKKLTKVGDYNKLVKTLRDIYGDPTDVITKKIISPPKISTGVSTKLIQKTTNLKSILEPKISLVKVKIKDILGIGAKADTTSKILSRVGLASALTTRISTRTRQGVLEKSALEPKIMLRNILRTKTIEDEALKTATGLLSAQAQILTQKQLLKLSKISISAPVIPRIPVAIPTFKIPTIPTVTIPFAFPSARPVKRIRERKKKGIQELLLLPDFTARVIGLEPKVLSGEQAVKEIKKIMTGLEIRRGVQISKLPQ